MNSPAEAQGTTSPFRGQSLDFDVYAVTNDLARRRGAVNLGQGSPDFDGPPELLEAAARAVASGLNQYSPPPGLPVLREAVARHARRHGLSYDPGTEVTITAGCTEGLAAAMLGLLSPGDEVLAFEPYYDYYPGLAALAGARLVPVPLRQVDDGYAVDPHALAARVSARTRMLLVNTPHNPTGHVLTAEEIGMLAEVAKRHDLPIVTDEVYQDLTYEAAHASPALTLRERTIVCSSASKTLSACGWRIGWILAPPEMTARLRRTHRHLTCCAPTPLQAAVADGLTWAMGSGYLDDLRDQYATRRGLLLSGLRAASWHPIAPKGGYVLMARSPDGMPADPMAANESLATTHGVAGLPLTPFFGNPDLAHGMLRFAFCKEISVIESAVRRLTGTPAATVAHAITMEA